ncbi:MAG: hypothetical protein B7Z02_03125 [Rhodobacterales bacterium 32-67-9]|nr:MAG: hypothetical protein B7Z02_03125 [Rhodobacterales bacterium 32-67-9]
MAEIMTTGRAYVLWSFLKASFWTLGLLSVAALVGADPGLSTRPLGLLGLSGGLLFGIGAGMIPGGNDGLILFGIPSLSPHALPSWFGIVAGIWLALVTMRVLGARVPVIRCESDICRASL